MQARVHGDPAFVHPGSVGGGEEGEGCGTDPEDVLLVEEATRENCKRRNGNATLGLKPKFAKHQYLP